MVSILHNRGHVGIISSGNLWLFRIICVQIFQTIEPLKAHNEEPWFSESRSATNCHYIDFKKWVLRHLGGQQTLNVWIFKLLSDLPCVSRFTLMIWPETWYNTNRHSRWPLDTSSLRTSKWACPLVSVFLLSKISTENNEALQREEKLRGPRICKRVRRISVIQDEDNWFKLSHRYIYSRSVIKKQLIQNWILIVLQRR